MPPPRVTIDELPLKAAPEDTDIVLVQDAGGTKHTTVGAIKGDASTDLASHLSDPVGAHAASAISATDSGGGVDGTTVQAQLGQLASGFQSAIGTATTAFGLATDHINDAADAHDAMAISFTPDGGIAATDVQSAVVEVADSVGAIEPGMIDSINVGLGLLIDTSNPRNPIITRVATAAAEAVDVGFTPAGTITATDVQAAIESAASLAADLGSNVRTHGAVGDGVTDDTAAIYAAVQAAGTAGTDPVVLLPKGTWCISNDLVVDKTVHFVGQGAELLVTGKIEVGADDVRWSGVTFRSTSTTHTLLKTLSVAGSHKGWRWENCRFVNTSLRLTRIGREQTDGSSATTGTDLNSDCVISGCEFTGSVTDYTLEIGGQTDTLIEGCYFHDYGLDVNEGEGLKVLARSTGTRIIGNTFKNGTRDGIDIYDSWRNTITDNVFRSCGANGLEVKWDATDAFDVQENIISNNRAEACGSGFNLAGDLLTATGNVAQGCTSFGFRIGASVDGTATASTLITLIGNISLGNGGDGFTLGGTSRASVVGNSAFGNTGFGFSCGSTLTASTITANVASGNTGGDFNPSTPVDLEMVGNRFAAGLPAFFGVMPNNVPLGAKNAAGTIYEVVKLLTGGSLSLGNSSIPTSLLGTSVTVFPKITALGEVEIDGALNHDGTTIGFYGTAPIAKQTGVTVDAAGIHAALVALGLIGA